MLRTGEGGWGTGSRPGDEEACLPERGPEPGWETAELQATDKLGRTLILSWGRLQEPPAVSDWLKTCDLATVW